MSTREHTVGINQTSDTSSTIESRICNRSDPVLPCARRLSAIASDIIRKKRVVNCETGQSIFNDPYSQGQCNSVRLCYVVDVIQSPGVSIIRVLQCLLN